MGLRQEALRQEAEASTRLDGDTVSVGPVTVGAAVPSEPAELERLAGSITAAQEKAAAERQHARHGVPDSAVADPANPDGRVFGAKAGREVAVPTQVQQAPRLVQGTPLHLTPDQHRVLLMGINSNRVKVLRGQSHVEAWDVRRTLTRIFGFGGWGLETIELALVREITYAPGELIRKRRDGATYSNDAPVYTVVYRCQARLTIKNPDGSTGAVFEDGASGSGDNQPNLGDAHDQAMKTALSQALKRCAANLGDQFGLSLYNDGSHQPQVNVTLVGPVMEGGGDVAEQAVQSEKVKGEQVATPAGDQPPEDPGEGSGPTGLPTAIELRDEALDPRTETARLSAIYQMVHRGKGTHPALGSIVVLNETGDDEGLDHLVYRKMQERKSKTERTS